MTNTQDSYQTGQLHLRYNRAERLQRASKTVQQMYEPDYISKHGLLKGLTATRASRSILFSIIIVCIVLVLSVFFQFDRTTGKISGIPVKLESVIQEKNLYAHILLEETKKEDTVMIPLTVYITARHSETGMQESKTIEAVYIGSRLLIPVQFQAEQCNELEAVILMGNKNITLHSSY